MEEDGLNEAVGYTFNVNPNSFGDLLATWKPIDVSFCLFSQSIEFIIKNCLEIW